MTQPIRSDSARVPWSVVDLDAHRTTCHAGTFTEALAAAGNPDRFYAHKEHQ